MDIVAQAEKFLRNTPPESGSKPDQFTAAATDEYESDHSYVISDSFITADRAAISHSGVSQQEKFSDRLIVLSAQKLRATFDERNQLKFDFRDHWTSGFLESLRLRKESLRQEIFASKTQEEVLDVLSENGLEEFRQDYADYLIQRQNDLDEGENPNIFLQSLQSWAWFILDYTELKNLPRAEINADFDGCLEMEWELSFDEIQNDPENEFYGNGRGLAVLTFYPASLNHLSILSGAYTGAKQRITLDCFLPHKKTRQIIDLFTERLLNPDE